MIKYILILFCAITKSFLFCAYSQSAVNISGNNSYISIENTPEINLSEFTIECWFMMKDTGMSVLTGVHGIDAIPLITKGIEEDISGANMNYFLGIRKKDSVLVADFEESITNYHKGKNHPVTGFTTIKGNVWYHAALSYDGMFLQLYLDGSLESAVEINRLPMNQGNIDAVIGSVLLSGGTSEGYFHGTVDEVRIWDHARSLQEIQNNINKDILSVLPGLVLRLGLNEGSGDETSYTGMPGLNIDIVGSDWDWVAGTSFENINPPASNDSSYLKIGLIADPQYCDCPPSGTRFYRESMWKLPAAVDTFNKYDVDFVMTLGDFIDIDYESFDSILPLYNILNMPDYKLLGNHEFEIADSLKDKVIHLLNMPDYYYDFDYNNWRFIVLDGTELAEYDSILHMDLREEGDSLWQSIQGEINDRPWNGGIGRTQRNWLENKITDAMNKYEKVILFCHFPLYPTHNLNLWNRFQIIDIVEKYDNVIAYINGHNHDGNYALLNSKHYITQKAMIETYDTSSFSILSFYNNKLVFNSFGLMNDQILTFKNKDKKPYDILLSNNILTYNLDSGSYIGCFSTIDSSSSAGYSYGLIDAVDFEHNALFHVSGDSLFLSTNQDVSMIENIKIKAASKNCNLDTISKNFTIYFDTIAVSSNSKIQDTTLILGQPDLIVNLDSVFTDKSEYGLIYNANSGNENKAAVFTDSENLTVEPLSGGKSTIIAVATDSYTGQSVTDTFDVTIFDPLNHYPVVQNFPGDMIVQLENDSLIIDLDTVFYDEDSDTLIYEITCSNDTTVYYLLENSILSLFPLKVGVDSLKVSADDDRGGINSVEFPVKVNGSPYALNIPGDILIQLYDDPLIINLDTIFSDPDNDSLNYNVDSITSAIITTDITDSELNINQDASGSVIIYVSAKDAFGGIAYCEFNLTINSSPQVHSQIPDLSLILLDTTFVYIDLDTVFFDPDEDSLQYEINNSNSDILTIIKTGSGITLSPLNQGVSLVEIQADDQRGGFTADSFNVTINEPSNFIVYNKQSDNVLTCYPNPFNYSTVLAYDLYESSSVVISIYNQYGEFIKNLISGYQTPGSKKILINAKDFSPGIYLCKIEIDNNLVETKKMVILR